MYKIKNLRTREIIAESEILEELIRQNFYTFPIHAYTENDSRNFCNNHLLNSYFEKPDYITILDSNDLIVSYSQVNEVYNKVKTSFEEAFYNRRHKNDPAFRQGPIPLTGKKNYRGYHRRPQTTSERRYAASVKVDEIYQEYTIKFRKKRNHKTIVNNWDDVGRADFRDRSWKTFRKTQWK